MLNLLGSVFHEIQLRLSANKKFASMAVAALVLTLAAGITTHYGIYNHSGKPGTSLLITLGLQLFLLALAWYIGEVMATGLGGANPSRSQRARAALLGVIALIGMASGVLLHVAGVIGGLGMIGAVLGAIVVWILFSAPRHFAPMACYMLIMSVSVFFSFDYHYSGFSPHEKRTNEAVKLAQAEVDNSTKLLLGKVRRELEEQRREIVEGGEWQAFETKIDVIAKSAEQQRDRLTAIFQAKQSEAKGRLAAAAATREDKQKRVEELKLRKESLRPEIERLSTEKGPLDREVNDKRSVKESKDAEVELKKAQIKNEIEQGREGRRSKCGPVCRELKKELVLLQQDQAERASEYNIARNRLKPVERDLAAKSQELAAADAEIARFATELGVADSTVSQAEKDAFAPDAAEGLDANLAKGLERTAETYRSDPTEASYATLVTQCTGLVTTMRGIPGLDLPASFDCSPGAYATTSKNYFDRLAREAALRESCGNAKVEEAGKLPLAPGDVGNTAAVPAADDPSRAPKTKAEQRIVFKQLVELGRRCVRLAPLARPEDGQGILAAFTNLELVVDPEANNKIAANLAALDRGDGTAYLALLIATTIDALILLAAIYGARANVRPISFVGTRTPEENQKIYGEALEVDPRLHGTEPYNVQKAKIVLGRLVFRPPPDKTFLTAAEARGPKYPAAIDIGAADDVEKTVIGQTLLSFGEFIKEDESGQILVDERLVHHLQEEIVNWQTREAASGRATTVPLKIGTGARARRPARPPIIDVESSEVRPDAYFDRLVDAASNPAGRAAKTEGRNLSAAKKGANGTGSGGIEEWLRKVGAKQIQRRNGRPADD